MKRLFNWDFNVKFSFFREPSYHEEVILVMQIVNIIEPRVEDHYRVILNEWEIIKPILGKYFVFNADYIHNDMPK